MRASHFRRRDMDGKQDLPAELTSSRRKGGPVGLCRIGARPSLPGAAVLHSRRQKNPALAHSGGPAVRNLRRWKKYARQRTQ